MEGVQGLILGDLDIDMGLHYCGGEEGYYAVLKVLFDEMPENKKKVQNNYDTQNWELYITAVHGIKSSMLSIGALNASEMARKLEMAGKNESFSYIAAYHDEMLEEYDRIYEILSSNPQINSGSNNMGENCNLPEIGDDQIKQYIDSFEEAVYNFDEAGMLEVLSWLQQYQWRNYNLQEFLAPVKRKVESMDYMSALDMLQQLK